MVVLDITADNGTHTYSYLFPKMAFFHNDASGTQQCSFIHSNITCNDTIDQAERFKEQQKLRDAGDQEAQRYDKDFIEALEHGMPPTCGFGVSERLFSFLIDKPGRECQIFPLMRPKQ